MRESESEGPGFEPQLVQIFSGYVSLSLFSCFGTRVVCNVMNSIVEL